MRAPLKWSLILAAIPVVGWFASLAHNWWLGGEFFHYSPMAYLPLIAGTFPCQGLLRWMTDLLGEHTHRVVFFYMVLVSAIYALVGLALGLCYQVTKIRLNKLLQATVDAPGS
jgi:hypothetical protein